jgi:hypothetical protein
VKKSLALFVTMIVLLSTLLAGCPPPRPGHAPHPPHPPVPHHP